jgi:cytoskeleton protein RodZ
METAGARLKKLRLEKGISLEEVQKKTKIHLDVLKSIEEDSLVNLNPVYIKGFVKIYCGCLGADPGEYLSGYKANGTAIPSGSAGHKDDGLFWGKTRKPFLLKPQVAAIIAAVVILFFLSLGLINLVKFFSSKAGKAGKSRAALALPKPKPAKKAAKKPSIKAKAAPPAVAAEKKSEAIPASSGAAVLAPADNQEPGVRIGLHALEDCWVQARLDGKIIFQNILKKGRFESWSAKDKVELSLGSAGGVRLEVNGKLIPSLGRKGQPLKNILITKDGLKVGK